MAAEAAAEPLDAGYADALQLACIAVKHVHAGVGQELPHLGRLARLPVVIAEYGGNGNAQR